MIYLRAMVIKKFINRKLPIKYFFNFLLMFLLTSCPGSDDDCFDQASVAEVPNLITLSPEDNLYAIGDILNFKLIIPATNLYFGSELSIYGTTADESARLVLNFNQLFIDNQLTFIKGSPTDTSNWFDMVYNIENDSYELEINIRLNRLGSYSFTGGGSAEVQGNASCARYRIDTNVIWNYINGKIEFTVVE